MSGATLGVLGGDQLGRMFTVAAQRLGYRVIVLDPDPEAPAAALAYEHIYADFLDQSALERLGRSCAAITVEAVAQRAPEPAQRLAPRPHTSGTLHARRLRQQPVRAAGAGAVRHAARQQ